MKTKPDYTQLDKQFLKTLTELKKLSPEAQALEIQRKTMTYLQGFAQELVLSKGSTDDILEKMGETLSLTEKALKDLSNKPQELSVDSSDVAKAVADGIKQIQAELAKIDVRPEVNVEQPKIDVAAPIIESPNVDVTVDTTKIEKLFKQELPKIVQKVVDSIPETDNTELAEAIDATNLALEDIKTNTAFKATFPSSMSVTGALSDTELRAAPVPTTINNTLVPEQHDEIQATYPTTSSEVYTYKLSGVSVAVVTVTYTSDDKQTLTSVVRT